MAGSAEERNVRLDRCGPDRTRVVGVAIQGRETGDDSPMGGVERLVIGRRLEAGSIVGPHDVPGEIS